MNNDTALQLVSEMFKIGLILCAPLLGLIMLVGLLISILQVVTQVQDASISFVPKLISFVVAVVLLAPWMLGKLTSYAGSLFIRLAQIN